MNCPECDSVRTKVVCTGRDSEKRIIRRRKCLICNHRWYSIQYPEVFIPPHRIKWTKKGYTVRPYLSIKK